MHLINLYSFSIVLFCAGLYITLASEDFMKKLFGLSLFQNSVLWFYISLGKVSQGLPPILLGSASTAVYSNPLPHVLMLTAIVVGIATIAIGFTLVIKINKINL
jgi:multicomponent Na+:H+ antiporter subunit C